MQSSKRCRTCRMCRRCRRNAEVKSSELQWVQAKELVIATYPVANVAHAANVVEMTKGNLAGYNGCRPSKSAACNTIKGIPKERPLGVLFLFLK